MSEDAPPPLPTKITESTRRDAISLASGPIQSDTVSQEWGLKQELAASLSNQDKLVEQLSALREASSLKREDTSSEVSILRSSLALMTSALAEEKGKREVEEKNVTGLRATVEQSRIVIGRLQSDSMRNASPGPPSRRSSLRLVSPIPITQPPTTMSSGVAVNTSPNSRYTEVEGRGGQSVTSEINTTPGSPGSGKSIRDPGGVLNSNESRSARIPVYDFSPESERRKDRRNSGVTGMQSSSICEDFGGYSRPEVSSELDTSPPSAPPSATLRTAGRNNSFAVFDDVPRRDSISGSPGTTPTLHDSFWHLPFGKNRNASLAPESSLASTTTQKNIVLTNQVASLTIRLKESEDRGRRTSVSLESLISFISAEGDSGGAPRFSGLGVIVPPLADEAPGHDGKSELDSHQMAVMRSPPSYTAGFAGIETPSIDPLISRISSGADGPESPTSTGSTHSDASNNHRPIVPSPLVEFGNFTFSNYKRKIGSPSVSPVSSIVPISDCIDDYKLVSDDACDVLDSLNAVI